MAEGASRNEIRSAFRNLALTHHADRGGQDEEFIIIKQAFDLKLEKSFLTLDEKEKVKIFWGTDEEERLRQNTLLSNDVAREVKVAQEWIDALNRTDTTGIRLFGSNELGQIEVKENQLVLYQSRKIWAGKFHIQIMYSCGAV